VEGENAWNVLQHRFASRVAAVATARSAVPVWAGRRSNEVLLSLSLVGMMHTERVEVSAPSLDTVWRHHLRVKLAGFQVIDSD